MAVRAYRPDDEVAVRRVVTEAFGEEGEKVAALAETLRHSHARRELVAEVAGLVAGHVMLSRSWVDARRELVEVLVLSPLSVTPAQQGQGAGGVLLAAAVDWAERLGAPAVFLEGDPGYYSRHGFEPATPRGFTRPSIRVPEPAFQVRVLESHRGWMTGALIYCEPFWSLDCVGLRDPALARFERMFES